MERIVLLLAALAHVIAGPCATDEYVAHQTGNCTVCPLSTHNAQGGAGVGACLPTTRVHTVPRSIFLGGQPMGIDFVGESTHVVVSDALFNVVMEFDLARPDLPPTVIAGQNGSLGICLDAGCENDAYEDNADGLAARFTVPTHVRTAPGGRFAFVADTRASAVRRIDLGDGSRFTDTVLSNSFLDIPYDVAFSPDARYMFVADAGAHVVYRVETFASSGARALSRDAPWDDASGRVIFGQANSAGSKPPPLPTKRRRRRAQRSV